MTLVTRSPASSRSRATAGALTMTQSLPLALISLSKTRAKFVYRIQTLKKSVERLAGRRREYLQSSPDLLVIETLTHAKHLIALLVKRIELGRADRPPDIGDPRTSLEDDRLEPSELATPEIRRPAERAKAPEV